MHDVVIRNGALADGSGAELVDGDIAIDGGRIANVGRVSGRGREEIDARGLLVTPGFVDPHTHYDGQVTWENHIVPSSLHGVTTVIIGNCGVGFAPCRPDDRLALVELMTGVEDIPEAVMAEGLPWSWVTFPEYLDAVAARPHDVDVAAMLPHSALRVFVMGERAIKREPAKPADIEHMSDLTREAVQAGAIGFATSRSFVQRSATGAPIPTVRATEDELRGILGALAATGRGVFQLLSDFFDFEDIDGEFAMLRRLVTETRRPTFFTLHQYHRQPERWREVLALAERAFDDGLPIRPQILGRPTGLLLGHDVSFSPFRKSPTYTALSDLPLDERVAELRRPEVRERILAEVPPERPGTWEYRFELCDPPDYEPEPDESFATRARRAGTTAEALAYDALLEDGGTRLILHAFQDYAYHSLDVCYEMLRHPATLIGLGDGGAHCGLICDASYPTTMLTHWVRDRTRGPRLPIPDVVRALTAEPAEAAGLCDRGLLKPGYRADLNVIDLDCLRLRPPYVVRDLPAGGRRILQRADGYRLTLLGGVVTQVDGEPTGALPGVLVRGPRPAPVHAERTVNTTR